MLAVPTSDLAEKMGTIKVANMIMLGAFLKASNIVAFDFMLNNLQEILGEGKAKMIKLNRQALEAGYTFLKE